MRKMLMAILALAAAWSLMVPVRVFAQSDEGIVQEMRPEGRDVTRAARLRTAIDPADPDTVWIGHIYDPTYTAGGTMTAGGYGPYHVGRGPNRPTRAGVPVTIGDNGTWDWDRFQPGEDDSLQGWWPIARPYQSGALAAGDFRRAFQGLDYGNQVNYVINQGAPKRTFGVTGLWHRDAGNTVVFSAANTIPGTNPQPVLWSPAEVGLGGVGSTASAWMGLRSHGDLSHRDDATLGGTGNPFDGSLLQHQGNNGFNAAGSVSVTGTDHNFPGYGSQMDQMLYRDVQLTETGTGSGLTISFNFSTNMSKSTNSTQTVQTGWFDKDPISNAQSGVGGTALPTSDGNYISPFVAGANAPVDSFMVYVGAPVDDDNVTFSAPLFVGINEITTVYDKKRRWFSEVLQLASGCALGAPCTIIGKEIVGTAGVNGATAVSLDFGAIYPAALQAIKDADGTTGDGGIVRIVFRVKTNRGFDDENAGNPSAGFNSGTRGAAIVDNVVVNGWAAAEGDFENASGVGAINNDTAIPATSAWKSTGKPPAVYFHVHSMEPGQGLLFSDPCGNLNDPLRQCNMYGKVATSGDHDASEKDGGLFGSNTQDRQRWFVSPTINLSSTGNGPGFYNAMGIDDEIARVTGDYTSFFSIYNAGFVSATATTGNFFAMGYQSYPARQINGNISWGETRHTAAISFYGPPRGCFETLFTGAKSNSLILTTNPEFRPDSLRVYLQRISRCYTFGGLVAATCSPTVGANVGTYYDNFSLRMLDAPPPPGITIPIWMLINDAFPANGNDALIPAGFDTCAAQIRIGLNNAAQTNTLLRKAISGDSVVVTASGASQRLDMVFRVLPGPGNYVTTGSKASGVAQRPDLPVKVAATPGDGTFFGQYMANTGGLGSEATHPGGVWNQNIWNSARMDTIENNLFPTPNNVNVVGLAAGFWAGMYHESDSKFATLGIVKNRCVMAAPGGFTNSINIRCDQTGWDAYDPALGVFTSGWDGVKTTREYTKIIPDGLLTPGSHVQYFFRKSDVTNTAVFEMGPDTNFVIQGTEGSTDGHRWQQFGVLPDRWKDGAWSTADRNAPAPACMLYVDWSDRRGDERLWVGIADTIAASVGEYIGGFPTGRWGAHNGWHARGDQSITVAIATDPTIAVYTHGGQPGTTWDMYGVKASESATTSSSLGTRAASLATGFQVGKDTRNGPSGKMLRNYYRVLMVLTGDLSAGNIGPYVDKGDNDIGLLNDFASSAEGTLQPRAVWFQGRNFVEGQVTGGSLGHPTFPTTFFGAGLVSGDYRFDAGNTSEIIDLVSNPPVSSTTYGLASPCTITNDWLTPAGTFGAAMAAKYPDTGVLDPKIASIYAPAGLPGSAHPMVTLVDGWRIFSIGSRNTLEAIGRTHYFWSVITNLFGALNCSVASSQPVGVGDMPNSALVNFLALRSENPMRNGAKIVFGITRKEKVELKVYDVTGRLVKTLANREFTAGEHPIFWDGSNDDGQQVSRGVYFYQVRTPSFVSQRKLAVLQN